MFVEGGFYYVEAALVKNMMGSKMLGVCFFPPLSLMQCSETDD